VSILLAKKVSFSNVSVSLLQNNSQLDQGMKFFKVIEQTFMFSFILCLIGLNFHGAKPIFLWFKLVPKSKLVEKKSLQMSLQKKKEKKKKNALNSREVR